MAAAVRDIMDPEPATVRPDTPVEEVVATLRETRVDVLAALAA
jgi:CBS domain-containing protein